MFYPRLASFVIFALGSLLTYIFSAVVWAQIPNPYFGGFKETLAAFSSFASLVVALLGFYGVITSFGIESAGYGFRVKNNSLGRLLSWLNKISSFGKKEEDARMGFCAFSAMFALAITLLIGLTALVCLMGYTAVADWKRAVRMALGLLAFGGILVTISALHWRKQFPRLGNAVLVTGYLGYLGFALYAVLYALYDLIVNGWNMHWHWEQFLGVLTILASIGIVIGACFAVRWLVTKTVFYVHICPPHQG